MKVIPLNKEVASATLARQLEQQGELKKAASMYEKLAKSSGDPLPSYMRLLTLYRKLGLYDKEIAVINKAISTHLDHYKPKKNTNVKADKLAKQLNIALGIANEKGKIYYKPEEVLKLEKRRAVAEKKKEKKNI